MSGAKNGNWILRCSIVIMLLLALCHTQDSNNIPLKPDGTAVENYLESRGANYYKVKIGDDYNGKDDLVLTIKPADAKSDPDLFVSMTNQNPNDMASSDFVCAMVGEDICTIPASDLSKGKTVYIGAKCYKKCTYHLSAKLETETEIQPKKDYKFNVGPDQSKILVFQNKDDLVKELVFTARTTRQDVSLSMYLTEGKEEAPSSDNMRANEGWENGIVIKLTDKSIIKVQKDQYYKLLIEADSNVIVDFRADALYTEKLLEEGEAYEDYVNYNDKTCYKYIVKNSDQKLRVGAYSFSGNPDIYVHPENIPENYDEFAFKATEASDDVLVITPEEKAQNGPKKGIYYICIRGNSNTSYRIRVVESDTEYYLEDGIAETNVLHSSQDHTFYYTDEALDRDLNITFTLSIKSGPRPTMKIKFCGRVPEGQCVIGSGQEEGLIHATHEVGKLYAFATHYGSDCKVSASNQEHPCVYAIEIKTPTNYKDDMTHFSLVAYHNETSHIKLREGQTIEQIVQNHEQRFYQFIVRDPTVTDVIFAVTSHHGDADLFVSRIDKYPDLKNHEMKSDKSRRFIDEVTYHKEENQTLQGIYYIGVQGFEYSSFSVRATVKRSGDTSAVVPIEISEGIPLADHINGTDERKYYQFKTYMYGESISDIKISITQYMGKARFYIKQGALPTEQEYDYYSTNGEDILMRSSDREFQPVGTKYILVIPDNTFGVQTSYLRYVIEYTTRRSISEIRKDTPVYGSAEHGDYSTYKYIAVEKGEDLTVSLTPLSGDPNLLVSINPNLPNPTIENNDYHSRNEGRDSVTIKGSELFQKNPSCNPQQQMALGAKPCEAFIAVYCADGSGGTDASCAYSLKIYTDNKYTHLLIDGTPQKDSVPTTNVMYYHINVLPERDYLYISASATKGDIGVYVNFEDYGTKEDELVLPTSTENTKKGKLVGHSQLVHFTKKEIASNCENYSDCMAVIAVQGLGEVDLNDFSIVAYTHVPKLIPNTPMVGRANKDTMMYYTYTSYCEKCTVLVSASAYSVDADLDLFINVGKDKELPTKDQHDIMSDNWFSEVVALGLFDKYFEKNKIDSMKQVFIIGVYAKTDTTFTIEIEDSNSEVKMLKEHKGVQIDQDQNDQKFFIYHHRSNDHLKFDLTMLTGSVNMRINKYKKYGNYEPEHKFLPVDDKNSLWRTNSKENTTIRINDEDDNFCSGCFYLVGIQTNEYDARYILEVTGDHTLATKSIKLGVPIKDHIADDDIKHYMFVLDRKAKFRINLSTYMGEVKYAIGKTENFDKAIKETSGSYMEIDGKALDKFEEGENVYIKVKGKWEHSEFILLVTHFDSYSILPDSFPQTFTINPHDNSGLDLIYYPPSLQFQLKMQVNSFSEGMLYDIYVKKEYVKNITDYGLLFPDLSQKQFLKAGWNKDTLMFSEVMNVDSERDDPFVFLIKLVPKVTNEETLSDSKEVKVSVSFSSHEVNILSANIAVEDYLLADSSSHRYYRFFANGESSLEIVLTPCVCNHDVFVFKSLDDAYSGTHAIDRSRHLINGEKKITLDKALGPYFLKISIVDRVDPGYLKPTDQCVFNLKFVDKKSPTYKYSIDDYVAGSDGKIAYSYNYGGSVKFEWDSVYKETAMGTQKIEARNSLIYLKKPNMFMNSVCGVNHAIKRKEAVVLMKNIKKDYKVVDLSTFKQIGDEPVATFTVFAYVNREGAAIPYQQVSVDMRGGILGLIPWWVYVLLILILVGFVISTFYFRRKVKKVQSKLDFEMNDIRNVARVGYADDAIERARINV